MSGARAVTVTAPKPVLAKTLLSSWYNTAEVPAMARALLIKTFHRGAVSIRPKKEIRAGALAGPGASEPAGQGLLRSGRYESGFRPAAVRFDGGAAPLFLYFPPGT